MIRETEYGFRTPKTDPDLRSIRRQPERKTKEADIRPELQKKTV
jgi:hypothetical protein